MVLGAAAAVLRAQPDTAVRGTVRDSAGVPQMGVAVELLGADARVVAAAFTGLDGRYVLPHLVPGVYQLRATATLYLPAMRSRLQLRAGDLPTVNVTMSGLLDQAWLPVGKARRDDQPDDWQWTLRSSANRPLLRVLDEAGRVGQGVGGERPQRRVEAHERAAVESVSGRFGGSGLRATVERRQTAAERADSSLIRLALTEGQAGGTAVDLAGGHEGGQDGLPVRRVAARLRGLPQMSLDGGRTGTMIVDVMGGQQTMLGDLGVLEAGSLLRVVRVGQTATLSYPFFRGEVHPVEGWAVGYAVATNPECQSLEDVGRTSAQAPAAGLVAGRLQLEQGVHQALFARRKAGRGVVEASLVHDDLRRVAIAGMQAGFAPRAAPSATELPGMAAVRLVDTTNGLFRELHAGYSSNAWQVVLTYPVLPATEITAEYAAGEALATRRPAAKSGTSPVLAAQHGQVARVAVQTTVRRTGTRLRAGYAWQPETLVTAVDSFAADQSGLYLSAHLRQPIHVRGLLPAGTVLSLDGDNLAREGYVTSSPTDAATTVLASTLRTLQAGMVFTF